MSKITKDDLDHLAMLSNLPLKDGEAEKFSTLLSDTISYIAVLDELDTTQVESTFQVSGLTNVFQEGSKNEVTLTQEEALENAQQTNKGLIVTKGVFDRS